ncbi:MAG: FHA domain-containing protein [Burkholderiaceae bacterium]
MPKLNFWNHISSAFERSDIGAAGVAQGAADAIDADGVRPTATRYAPIREAVERRVNAFLRQDLVSHLEIGFNEIFLLHYVEIAADSHGAVALNQFLHEFSPEARVLWVKKLLGPAVGRHVSVEQFLGLDKEFLPEALSETDPFEEHLNQAASPLYRVVLHGRWDSAPPAQAAAPAGASVSAEPPAEAPPSPLRVPGPRLRLYVQDAKAQAAGERGEARVAEIAYFPAVLGSSVHADVEVAGYYVSARHCTLRWEAGQLWLADHSTNGTWVDGTRIRRGSRVAVADGAALDFGRDRGDGDWHRYPSMRIQLTPGAVLPGASFTPVAPSASTPVAPAMGVAMAASSGNGPYSIPAQPENSCLAVLAIVDAGGNSQRDVFKLPFTIGRGSAQDYVVPDANQGVSREHMVIEAIDNSGAVICNRAMARNGTFSGGQALPERFIWRFGEEILLGEKWTGAPVVRMCLRNAEPLA